MVTSVTSGSTQNLPKYFKNHKTYRHDHSLESGIQGSKNLKGIQRPFYMSSRKWKKEFALEKFTSEANSSVAKTADSFEPCMDSHPPKPKTELLGIYDA
jgi:hypothetical protein